MAAVSLVGHQYGCHHAKTLQSIVTTQFSIHQFLVWFFKLLSQRHTAQEKAKELDRLEIPSQ